jgi:hypothetical protein
MLRHFGFALTRDSGRGQVYEGTRAGRRRCVVVPAQREGILPSALHSVVEQAGIGREEAIEFFQR